MQQGRFWYEFEALYGAARALAEAYRNDVEGLWRRLSPHLLRPQWAGVIPLTLAHLPGAQAITLVEWLLAANAGDEDRQRPLFLAAAALAEGAEVADGPHQRVVDELFGIARTRELWEFLKERASARDAVGALGRMVGDEYTAAGLLALARDEAVFAGVRVEAAEALGRLWRAMPEVLAGLRALAEEPETPKRVRVRRAARWALERLEG